MWGNLSVHLARDEDPDAHMTSVLYVHVDDADEVAGRWRKRPGESSNPKTKTTAGAKVAASTLTVTSSTSAVRLADPSRSVVVNADRAVRTMPRERASVRALYLVADRWTRLATPRALL
jgi:hypothetical protein